MTAKIRSFMHWLAVHLGLVREATPITVIVPAPPVTTPPPPWRPARWPWRGVDLPLAFPGHAQPSDLGVLHTAMGTGCSTVCLELVLRKYAERVTPRLTPIQAWAYAMTWIGDMLGACATLGMQAYITIDDAIPLPDWTGWADIYHAPFWGDPVQVAMIPDRAEAITTAFHRRGAELCGYDVIREPTSHDGGGRAIEPRGWQTIQSSIVAAIRAIDSERPIIAKPGPWAAAGAYHGFAPLADAHIIYSADDYAPRKLSHQGIEADCPFPVTYPGLIGKMQWGPAAMRDNVHAAHEFAAAHDVPMMFGEFSSAIWTPGGEQWLADMAAMGAEYGWGWMYQGVGAARCWDLRYTASTPQQVALAGMTSPRALALAKLFAQ